MFLGLGCSTPLTFSQISLQLHQFIVYLFMIVSTKIYSTRAWLFLSCDYSPSSVNWFLFKHLRHFITITKLCSCLFVSIATPSSNITTKFCQLTLDLHILFQINFGHKHDATTVYPQVVTSTEAQNIVRYATLFAINNPQCCVMYMRELNKKFCYAWFWIFVSENYLFW